jgi:hypothetical protein
MSHSIISFADHTAITTLSTHFNESSQKLNSGPLPLGMDKCKSTSAKLYAKPQYKL